MLGCKTVQAQGSGMVTLLEEMTLCLGARGGGVGLSGDRATRQASGRVRRRPPGGRRAPRVPSRPGARPRAVLLSCSPAVLLAPDASVPSGGAGAPQPLPLALQEAGGRSGAGEWAAGHRSVLSGAEETQALSPRGGSRVPISSYLQQPRKLALFYK